MPPRWQEFPDADTLHAHAADLILAAARGAIAARGAFHIVLAGGRTPLSVYARLAVSTADWANWRVYFGDERCLPRGDAGRNDTQAWRAWLERVPIPRAQVYAIPAELGPDTAAANYAAALKAVLEFDLVLLGLGEDGHTASLFPGHSLGAEPGCADVLSVRSAPKPPAERVSMSAARLSRARRVLFLVTGEEKRAAMTAWRTGQDIPARHIAPPGGVEVLLDAAAGK